MSGQRAMILGHRGHSGLHLENSMEAFRAALAAGMDGFELDVQPSVDGVCLVMHDETFDRTCRKEGIVRKTRSSELPLLNNGEPVPRLSDVLDLPARLVNVELKGEPGWRAALASVEAAEALDRVVFSSFEHSEILQLWAECPEARCGFLWESGEAADLTEDELAALPGTLLLHIPLLEVARRPGFWRPYADRLAVWGMASSKEAAGLGFAPAILIADAP